MNGLQGKKGAFEKPPSDALLLGKYNLSKLISRKFRLEEINEAYNATKERRTIGRWVCVFD